MAMFRNVHTSFWQDAKVCDDMKPEDRYMLLYMLTNPHTNILGCYELSKNTMKRDLGYDLSKIEAIMDRLRQMRVVEYDERTREVLLLNWHRYNWSASPKTARAILKALPLVKSRDFAQYVADIYNARDDVLEPYIVPDSTYQPIEAVESPAKAHKPVKHAHGEYGNVMLTDDELAKLQSEFPDWQSRVNRLSEYIESKGAKYKSHYATIKSWARKDGTAPMPVGEGVNDDALAEWL